MCSGLVVRRVLALAITISTGLLFAQSTLNPYDTVNPLIGTAGGGNTFPGATLPFARTRADREAAGDPRPAIAERYPSREDYLGRVGAAARVLAAERYLLDEDIETSLAFAARMWDAWAAKT